MSRLGDLLDSLQAVIVQYEVQKRGGTHQELLSPLPIEELGAKLEASVLLSTAETSRGPLLRYILETARTIGSLLHSSSGPLPTSAAENLEQQIIQFFKNIQLLLRTNQSTQITVQINEQAVSLYGCVNGIWPRNGLCVSGTLLQTHLLTPRGLQPDSSPEQVRSMAKEVVIEFQNQLSLIHLAEQNERLKRENELLQLEVRQLRAVNTALVKQNDEAALKISNLATELRLARRDLHIQGRTQLVRGSPNLFFKGLLAAVPCAQPSELDDISAPESP